MHHVKSTGCMNVALASRLTSGVLMHHADKGQSTLSMRPLKTFKGPHSALMHHTLVFMMHALASNSPVLYSSIMPTLYG